MVGSHLSRSPLYPPESLCYFGVRSSLGATPWMTLLKITLSNFRLTAGAINHLW